MVVLYSNQTQSKFAFISLFVFVGFFIFLIIHVKLNVEVRIFLGLCVIFLCTLVVGFDGKSGKWGSFYLQTTASSTLRWALVSEEDIFAPQFVTLKKTKNYAYYMLFEFNTIEGERLSVGVWKDTVTFDTWRRLNVIHRLLQHSNVS